MCKTCLERENEGFALRADCGRRGRRTICAKRIKPCLEEGGYAVQIVRYAEWNPGKVNNFLRSLSAMRAEYAFLTDLNHSPCITHRKERVCQKFSELNDSKVFVVIPEIEAWYLAGLSHEKAQELKIKDLPTTTSHITKEEFNRLMRGRSRLEFMLDLLERFSIEVALQRNESFRYFWERISALAPRQDTSP